MLLLAGLVRHYLNELNNNALIPPWKEMDRIETRTISVRLTDSLPVGKEVIALKFSTVLHSELMYNVVD